MLATEWFWAMAQFFAIIISLFLILRQIRIQTHANMLALFAQMEQRWNSEPLQIARREICSTHGQSKRITRSDEFVLSFFEDLGLYLKKNVLSADLMWEAQSYYVEHYWPVLQPKIVEFRLRSNDRSWYSNFEYLVGRLEKRSRKNGSTFGKSDEQLTRFLNGERERLPVESNPEQLPTSIPVFRDSVQIPQQPEATSRSEVPA
ncbi:MAG TPA: hypothetical protein VFY65_03045 [Longimicrobium sp.]|nr:hypothetical protein [Longimicrobium sp.]